jgi:hypothetical protein
MYFVDYAGSLSILYALGLKLLCATEEQAMFTIENSISKLIFTVFLGAKKGKMETFSLFYLGTPVFFKITL